MNDNDAAKGAEKQLKTVSNNDEDDLPYGLSVDWIISVACHSVNMMEEHATAQEPTLFGLKAHAALPSSKGSSNSSGMPDAFVHDQVTNGSSLFLLSPRPIKIQRSVIYPTSSSSSPSSSSSSSSSSYPVLTTPTNVPIAEDVSGNIYSVELKEGKEREEHKEHKEGSSVNVLKHLMNSPSQKKPSENLQQTDTKRKDNNEVSTTDQSPQLPQETEKLSLRVQALHSLFSDFDTNGDGSIDFDELLSMLDNLRDKSCLLHENGEREYIMPEFDVKEAEVVMQALDEDQNQAVEEREWIDWVTNGLEHPDIRNRLMAKGTILSKKLKLLLDAVEHISDGWIVKENARVKRRGSWYGVSQEMVDEYAKRLHNLVCNKNIQVNSMNTFFQASVEGIDVNDSRSKNDLVSRAACQLDHEGHHMCALHFLCWNAHFVPEMLRIFLENTGTDALHVEDGHGGTPIAHLLMNDSLSQQIVKECFALFRQYDPSFVDSYIESSGGFDSLWEQSKSDGEHFQQVDQDDALISDAIQAEDSMMAAAMQGGFLQSSVVDPPRKDDSAMTEENTVAPQSPLPPPRKPSATPRISILEEHEEEEEEEEDTDTDDTADEDEDGQQQPPPPPPPLPTPPGTSSNLQREEEETAELGALLYSPPHCRCENGHLVHLTKVDYHWTCDRCDRDHEPDVAAHACEPCDYTMCDKCCREAWITPYVNIDGTHVDDDRPYVIPHGILPIGATLVGSEREDQNKIEAEICF